MGGSMTKLWLGVALLLALASAPAQAKDRPFDRDWRTGVTVAPGAMTWTDDNVANKQQLINQIAHSQGRRCSADYAFLGWPPGNGGPAVIMQKTSESYQQAGYTIQQKVGAIATDTIWIARKDDREAVILWGAVEGSTIYLSCLTAGAPAANPDKGLYLGILLALGLGALLGGLWLMQRVRALGRAALSWPSVAGVVKSSEIASYKTKGGKQFMAKVTYDYAVGEVSYVGDRLRFGHYAGALAKGEADAETYKVGTPVEVLYDPNDPKTSVLEPGTAGVSVLGLVLAITGGLFLALTLLVAVIT